MLRLGAVFAAESEIARFAKMEQSQELKRVTEYLRDLQSRICTSLEETDGAATFRQDVWEQDNGSGRTHILSNGRVFEQGGVNFSHVYGSALPAAASSRHPELGGSPFQATGVSLVVHPHNPFIPTSHMNVRFFCASTPSGLIWWFGGGFDLTPYYGDEVDAVHWHQTALEACSPFGSDLYPQFKADCDDYFHLRHRNEQRGIGGLFFDDFSEGGFENAFALTRSIGDHYLPAYLPIVARHRDTPFAPHHREFQLYRRGRYVEFNLVYDRGTLFGLQSGGRIESILMSLPPNVAWRYDWRAEPGTPEADLVENFLQPKDWLAQATKQESS